MNNKDDRFGAEGAQAGRAFKDFVKEFVQQASPPFQISIVQKAAARAFEAYYHHVLDAAFDVYGIPKAASEEITGGERAAMCDECECQFCADQEVCKRYPISDGVTPPPCVGCYYAKSDCPDRHDL